MNFKEVPFIENEVFEERYFLIEQDSNFLRSRDCTLFKAFDSLENKDVFIKILNPNGNEIHVHDYQGSYTQFLTFNHPNIIQIRDILQISQFVEELNITQTLPILVFEYFQGNTLSSLIGQISINDLISIFDEIKNALDYLHQLGWVYRDLKSDNILLSKVDDSWQVKLIDIENMGQIGVLPQSLVGTPEYMPPEVSLSTPLSKEQDYWAMGCVMFECIQGHFPFGIRDFSLTPEKAIVEIKNKISEEHIVEILEPIVFPQIKLSLSKCLQIQPTARSL